MGCLSVCPTEAFGFSLDGCFGSEGLILSSFEGIETSIDERLFERAAEYKVEADRFLGFFGALPASLVSQQKESTDEKRRALFKMFTKDGIKSASNKLKTDEELAQTIDFERLKTKKIPQKREQLLEKLKGAKAEGSMALGFAAQKYIDNSCDGCSLCYNLCPSGALESTAMKNAIIFSPHLCLKCKLCEDVCEPKAISSLPEFEIQNFCEQKKSVLIKFKVKLCPSCGLVFSTDGEECPRCAKESEDAMELLGL